MMATRFSNRASKGINSEDGGRACRSDGSWRGDGGQEDVAARLTERVASMLVESTLCDTNDPRPKGGTIEWS